MSQAEKTFCQAISEALKTKEWPAQSSRKITFPTPLKTELEVIGVTDSQVLLKSMTGGTVSITSEQHFRSIVRNLNEMIARV